LSDNETHHLLVGCGAMGFASAQPILRAAALVLTIVVLPALAQQTLPVEACGASAALDDEWLTDTPENVGLVVANRHEIEWVEQS
jgi:hypothetical protein